MKRTGKLYPRVSVDSGPCRAVGQAGGVLLTRTVDVTGMGGALSGALAGWRKPFAVHDPGKIITDLALSLALGGDCLADVGLVRCEPGVYGPVASDPTISRLIGRLAKDALAALKAINIARAAARAQAWALAGEQAPDHGVSPADPLIVDVDATLVTAHSDKENAKPTFKKGYGFHPLCAFVDHGAQGTGELLAIQLRPGNAGSNTAADHIAVLRDAFRQLPGHSPDRRPGKSVLVRTDGAGCTHQLISWLVAQRVQYSIGYTLPTDAGEIIEQIPPQCWTPAWDADGQPREGAWVAELTGMLNLAGWPVGMRVIARTDRPHPGAQLRITDVDGHRVTAFATNTPTTSPATRLAALELRHRRRARCEDRIRIAKDTGLTNLPLHGFAQNQIWCAIIALAVDLTAWMQLLALDGEDARRWEPKRLRHRLFTIPATLARAARRTTLHLASHHPWATLATAAIDRLDALPAPSG